MARYRNSILRWVINSLLITKEKYNFAKSLNLSIEKKFSEFCNRQTKDTLIEACDTRFRLINFYGRFAGGLIIVEV